MRFFLPRSDDQTTRTFRISSQRFPRRKRAVARPLSDDSFSCNRNYLCHFSLLLVEMQIPATTMAAHIAPKPQTIATHIGTPFCWDGCD
jgi:hypothetical protein